MGPVCVRAQRREGREKAEGMSQEGGHGRLFGSPIISTIALPCQEGAWWALRLLC